MSEIILTDAATALIKSDVSAFKRDRTRYSKYVAEMNVTADTVADHVAIFRNTYKSMHPKASGDEIKAYATKVRNGLNYWVKKSDPSAKRDDSKFVTAVGLKCDDREAFLAKCLAEWDAAHTEA